MTKVLQIHLNVSNMVDNVAVKSMLSEGFVIVVQLVAMALLQWVVQVSIQCIIIILLSSFK